MPRPVATLTRLFRTVFGAGLISPAVALAIPFVEVSDAGQLVGTAQTISGITPLTGIQGNLTSNDVDLFRFNSSGGSFTATVVSASTGGGLGDPQLFLFDALGRGVVANDDPASGGVLSSITATLSAGDYFLGISEFNSEPVGLNGQPIFPDSNPGLLLPISTSPLANWTDAGGSGFSYIINLTNAGSVPGGPGAGVPDESSSLILMVLGCVSLLSLAHRLRN